MTVSFQFKVPGLPVLDDTYTKLCREFARTRLADEEEKISREIMAGAKHVDLDERTRVHLVPIQP